MMECKNFLEILTNLGFTSFTPLLIGMRILFVKLRDISQMVVGG